MPVVSVRGTLEDETSSFEPVRGDRWTMKRPALLRGRGDRRRMRCLALLRLGETGEG